MSIPITPKFHAPTISSNIFQKDIFKGKVAFITGGGSGICKAQAEALVRHGAKVVIVGRTQSKLDEAAKDIINKNNGSEVLAISADVRNISTLEIAVTKTIEKFNRIDFVICGAAGNFLAAIDNLSSNAFKTVIEIDLLGTYNTIKATIPQIKKFHGSYLVISANLHLTATPYQAHVSAAKAGIDALIQVVAAEYGPHGVRINSMAPGAVEGTEGASRLLPSELKDIGKQRTPIQRYGTLDDTANLAVFLFSDAASWITGTRIVIDGGAWLLGTSFLSYPETVLNPIEGINRVERKSKI